MNRCKDSAAKVEEREKTVGFLKIGEAMCTGTLISPRVVLTAAHCFPHKNIDNVRFSLAHDVDQKQEVFYANAAKVVIHPEYPPINRTGRSHADLAIVQLDSIDYGPKVESFYFLGGTNEVPSGSSIELMGYGVERHGIHGVKRPKHLLFESLEASTHDKSYKSGKSSINIGIGSNDDVGCPGDSGGPLLKYIKGHTRIVGIFSQGHGTVNLLHFKINGPGPDSQASYLCRAFDSSYAISVEAFLPWIESTRKQLETDTSFVPCVN